MYIVSKNEKAIINLEQITAMYIGSDGCSIKADYAGGNGCQLGKYNSDKEAMIALKIITENIGKTEIYYMPDNNAIQAKINLEEQRYHHLTGKKTKGHGGS